MILEFRKILQRTFGYPRFLLNRSNIAALIAKYVVHLFRLALSTAESLSGKLD